MPRLSLGSIKSNTWQLHWLDLVGINQYVKIIKIVHTFEGYSHFHILILLPRLRLYHISLYLAGSLATCCRYHSVCQTYQNVPNGLSTMAIFANWPRTDRRTRRLIMGTPRKPTFQLVESVDISTGRAICHLDVKISNIYGSQYRFRSVYLNILSQRWFTCRGHKA